MANASNINLRYPTLLESVLLLLTYAVLQVIYVFGYKRLTSPLRKLKCPPGGTTAMGHHIELMAYESRALLNSWAASLGQTFRVRGLFTHHRLYTLDPRAITHIMAQTQLYQKPQMLRPILRRYMKEGMIVSEGERQKVQRRVVGRWFAKRLKGMEGVVWEETVKMKDLFRDLCTTPTHTVPFAPLASAEKPFPTNTRIMDVFDASLRHTFDIIGLLSISHDFACMTNPHGEGGQLYEIYEKAQQPLQGGMGWWGQLSAMFPVLDWIRPTENSKRIKAAMDPLNRLSQDMVKQRTEEIKSGKRDLEEKTDLLTTMLRDNMSTTLAPEDRTTDDEITGQMATFMFAGSDTTGGTMAFALHYLSLDPELQSRLRTECQKYGETTPYDQLEDLPLLDAVVKEILRFVPSIPCTIREAQNDDVIPLSHPIIDQNGKTMSEVRIRKGQVVFIPIEGLHFNSSIWGPDAMSFRPDRWLSSSSNPYSSLSEKRDTDILEINDLRGDTHKSEPEDTSSFASITAPSHISPRDVKPASETKSSSRRHTVPSSVPDGPGLWPNIMTFIDGPRRCVGYKLALMELRIGLFALIRDFEFEPVEGVKIRKWNLDVVLSTRPYIDGQFWRSGSVLPLKVKLHQA